MNDLMSLEGTKSGFRLLASIIDNLFAMVFGVFCGYLIYLIFKYFNIEYTILIFIFTCIFYLFYFFFMESIWSRSLGKMFTGLEITNKDGSKISGKQALIRTIFRILEVNPLLMGGLPAALFIVFSSRKQRIGDILAKTVVNFKYD